MAKSSGVNPAEAANNPEQIKEHIHEEIKAWKEYDFMDDDLWSAFKDGFKNFTVEDFEQAPSHLLRNMRHVLRQRGVWVQVESRSSSVTSITIPEALINLLNEKEVTRWTEEELRDCHIREKFVSGEVLVHLNWLGLNDSEGPTPQTYKEYRRRTFIPRSESPGQRQQQQQLEEERQQEEGRQRQQAHEFRAEQINSPPPVHQTFNSPTPAPYMRPPPPPSSGGYLSLTPAPHGYLSPTSAPHGFSSPAPTSSGFRDSITALARLYTDEMKYGGENDSFSYKLTIFHDLCMKADVPNEAKLRAFSLMLKGRALDYYYFNVSPDMIFDQVCHAIKTYFEGEEYRRNVLNRWNNLTLQSVKEKNESKSMLDCFDLLIKDLRHLQHGLDVELHNDKFMHNKLILACQDVAACQYACYKPVDSLAGLINDLRSSIIINQKSRPTEMYFTDRRYHEARHRSDRSTLRPLEKKAITASFDSGKKKKCFVCGKERCWSSTHTREERHSSMARLRDRINWRVHDEFEKQASQYLAEYEGPHSEDEEDRKLLEELVMDATSFNDVDTQNIDSFSYDFIPGPGYISE